MPTKKRATKKRTAAKKRVERDIRRAVDSIPELLAEKTPPTDMRHEHEDFSQKRRILTIGVASFSLLILGLWYWNARTMVSRVFAAQSPEERLLNQAAENFQKTMNDVAAADVAARLAREADAADKEAEIAAVLSEEFAAHLAATASTTSDSATSTIDASLTE